MAKKKKKKYKDVKKKSSGLDPDVKRAIWSVSLVALAILSVLSFLEKTGLFGDFFQKLLANLFGWGMYVVPLVLIGIAGALLFSWGKDTDKSIFVAAFLFFLSILGFFSLTNLDQAVERGGIVGLAVSWPLNQFLGKAGAYVLLSAVLIIAIVLGLHVKLNYYLANFSEKRKLKKSSLVVPYGDDSGIETTEKEIGESQKDKAKEKGGVEILDYNKSNETPEEKNKSKEEFAEFSGVNKFANFELPSTGLLDPDTGKPTSGDIVANANIIRRTLQNFGINVDMGEVSVGPSVTQYTLKPAEGVKLARITALGNDLSLALAAHPIRIEAPIPGRSLVGIEIPNESSTQVRLKGLLENRAFREKEGDLVIALGRNVKGTPVYADLARMPHLMVAGSTGSGKTIAINALILSLLYKHPPQTLRLILIDPKRVEFSIYQDIPHLMAPIVVDNSKAVNALKWVVNEMERRFEILAEAKARDIDSYNDKKEVIQKGEILPYLVVAVDELADLMSSKGREVEALIVRIAQMARAVGIHLVLATQRPSVEVITGLIKANITARMAFQVASQVDSRTVLDMAGAEKLLGRGDMLFLSSDSSKPVRIQGAYINENEVKKVVEHLKKQKEKLDENQEGIEVEDFSERPRSPHQSVDFGNMADLDDDELYEEAKELVIEAGRASASYLQRKLRVGYARAARLLDMLEEQGVIGPQEGSKPRDVYADFEEN
ncbi:MAG: DNA translocase FtsK 4TM domain-containing protein [Candidatus Spechtbacteria bacterium]|nr:DNA translocase FtsK 4TM domain-containing protein [Candidatus Spechtbacteria bacterium]